MQYRIRVQGHLDPTWQAWFEQLTIQHEPSGQTFLYGTLPDQAALYRILLNIRRLGLVLLSLETEEPPQAKKSPE